MRDYIGQGLSKYMRKEGKGATFGLETVMDILFGEDGLFILPPARRRDCHLPRTLPGSLSLEVSEERVHCTRMLWKHILIPGLVELASLPPQAESGTGRLPKCI
jgi:hypothetical protein